MIPFHEHEDDIEPERVTEQLHMPEQFGNRVPREHLLLSAELIFQSLRRAQSAGPQRAVAMYTTRIGKEIIRSRPERYG